MALSDTDVKVTFLANGVTTAFAIPFSFIVNDSSETRVYTRDESTEPATEVLLIEGALQDYTLTGAVPPGTPFDTTVTFNTAPANGLKIVLRRILPLTQTLDLTIGGTLYADSLEVQLDRAIAMVQQLDEAISRAPKFNLTSPTDDVSIDEPTPGYIIGWNDDGDGITNYNPLDLVGESALAAHIADTSDAHDASAISVVPAGSLASTDVQAALEEIQADVDASSPVSGEVQQTLTNNVAATDVTGLLFDKATYRSIEVKYTIERRTATQGYRQTGRLMCSYEQFADAWTVDDLVDCGSSGEVTGVTFSITSSGQVQYATDDTTGSTYVGKMRHAVNYRFQKET